MIKKLFNHGIKFLSFSFHFNIIIAFKLLVLPYFQGNLSCYEQYAHKHKTIKNYLKRRYRRVIRIFKHRTNLPKPPFDENFPVWFFWWQGENLMPPIVKTCYLTLIKNAEGHKVNLITKDNISTFISLPDFILKKINKNHLSITHLSDMVRVSLLYEYGGLWMDSTVLLTGPLLKIPAICAHLGFWTPKDDGRILKICFGAENWIVREGKWLTFCFYAEKFNILALFVREMFFTYIKSKKVFIDYFLFDYFISIGYDTLTSIRAMIDSVPQNNPAVHEIQHRLGLDYEYNKELFDAVCQNTVFHKLDWKSTYTEYTESGKLTNYGYIINHFPAE